MDPFRFGFGSGFREVMKTSNHLEEFFVSFVYDIVIFLRQSVCMRGSTSDFILNGQTRMNLHGSYSYHWISALVMDIWIMDGDFRMHAMDECLSSTILKE